VKDNIIITQAVYTTAGKFAYIVWASIPPQEYTAVSWGENYCLFASDNQNFQLPGNVIPNFYSEVPASRSSVYEFSDIGFEITNQNSVFTYGVQNLFSHREVYTFGLAQYVTINDITSETPNPVNAVLMLANSTEYFIPKFQYYIGVGANQVGDILPSLSWDCGVPINFNPSNNAVLYYNTTINRFVE